MAANTAALGNARSCRFVDEWGKKKTCPLGRALLRPAIAKRIGRERNSAVECIHETRRDTLHDRIVDAGKSFGSNLGAGQNVAEIVLNLCHRETERCEPRLLL